jgi:hypothetical protein
LFIHWGFSALFAVRKLLRDDERFREFCDNLNSEKFRRNKKIKAKCVAQDKTKLEIINQKN